MYKLLLILVGIVTMVVGFVNISNPALRFRKNEKWKFKNDSEAPSEECIKIMKREGFFKIFVGIIILLLSLGLGTDTQHNNSTKNNNDTNNNSDTSSEVSFYGSHIDDYDLDGNGKMDIMESYLDSYIYDNDDDDDEKMEIIVPDRDY